MAMLGKVDDLTKLMNPQSRLGRGLALLQECLAARLACFEDVMANLQPGETRRVAVEGDLCYLLMQCYQTRPRNEGRFEAHARHTDLHYLWSGRERIEFRDLRASKPELAYDANGNMFFPLGDGTHSQLLLQAGEVAVLLPQDAHAPSLRVQDRRGELVRKVVVKIQDAYLPAGDPSPRVATNELACTEKARTLLKL
jgi:biofilm protein TabA